MGSRKPQFLLVVGLVFSALLDTRPLQPDGSRLRPGRDSLAIFVVRGADTAATGTLVDDLQKTTLAGHAVWRRVYRSQDRLLGNRLDTIVDRHSDLTPIRFRSRANQGEESIDFQAGRASGWTRVTSGDSLPIGADLPPGAINASSFDLYLRAAPLAVGFTTTVQGFAAAARSMLTLEARVAGSESIDGEPCWRVEAVFGGSAVTFWIGKESRRLRQQVMNIRPGVVVLFVRSGTRSRRSSSAT